VLFFTTFARAVLFGEKASEKGYVRSSATIIALWEEYLFALEMRHFVVDDDGG